MSESNLYATESNQTTSMKVFSGRLGQTESESCFEKICIEPDVEIREAVKTIITESEFLKPVDLLLSEIRTRTSDETKESNFNKEAWNQAQGLKISPETGEILQKYEQEKKEQGVGLGMNQLDYQMLTGHRHGNYKTFYERKMEKLVKRIPFTKKTQISKEKKLKVPKIAIPDHATSSDRQKTNFKLDSKKKFESPATPYKIGRRVNKQLFSSGVSDLKTPVRPLDTAKFVSETKQPLDANRKILNSTCLKPTREETWTGVFEIEEKPENPLRARKSIIGSQVEREIPENSREETMVKVETSHTDSNAQPITDRTSKKEKGKKSKSQQVSIENNENQKNRNKEKGNGNKNLRSLESGLKPKKFPGDILARLPMNNLRKNEDMGSKTDRNSKRKEISFDQIIVKGNNGDDFREKEASFEKSFTKKNWIENERKRKINFKRKN